MRDTHWNHLDRSDHLPWLHDTAKHRRRARVKRILGACLVGAAVFVLCTDANAESRRSKSNGDKRFGLGLMLGAPSGLSAKYHLTPPMALVGGLGVFREVRDHEGAHVHLDVRWQVRDLVDNRDLLLSLNIGVGGRILQHSYDYYWIDDGRYYGQDDTHVGIRLHLGLTLDLKRAPVDIFVEFALVMDVINQGDELCYDRSGRSFYCGWNHNRTDLNGAAGARYYF